MPHSTAIAALLTPRGRGAVATVVYRGDVTAIDDEGCFQAANDKPLAEQAVDRVVFGRWGGDPAEDVVVCRVAGDRFEVSCHGGDAAVKRILGQLESLGVKRVSWRDFLEDIDGPFAADVAEALSLASTERTAAIIARQASGPLRDVLIRLAQADVVSDRDETLLVLNRLGRWSSFGLHLTRPWRVVLYGPPNVGKSSLINALVGFERAIVFDQPGTTRDVVTVETAFDGWPIRFSDTAGLRETEGELEAAGIDRAKASLGDADLRILVLDRGRPSDPHLEGELAQLMPGLIVLNKSDLPDVRGEGVDPRFMTVVSAKTGAGVQDLLSRIKNHLVSVAPADDEPIPVTPRQVEAIRSAMDAVKSGDEAAYRSAMSAVFP
ncbi:MAG: GTPase [Planctomycetaceae bacterium]